MRVRTFDDVEAFHAAASPVLLRDEALWSLPLGVLLHLRSGGTYGDEPPWLALVEGDDVPPLVALRTPPRPLQLTHATRAQLAVLVDHLLERGEDPPGVVAPTDTALAFGELWTRASGRAVQPHQAQAVHRLDALADVPLAPGTLRLARPDEGELALRWTHRFLLDVGDPRVGPDRPPESAPSFDLGRMYVWDDGGPVSTAAWTRPTPSGVSIGLVYTPDELRGRGYASSVVWSLTRKLLDEGFAFTCLFTDLANPTSNAIYARIGYRRIGDFRYDRFVEPSPSS